MLILDINRDGKQSVSRQREKLYAVATRNYFSPKKKKQSCPKYTANE